MTKKRKKDDEKSDRKNENKHPGGPLQRTGNSSDSWNEAVGSSLEVIPQSTLPTISEQSLDDIDTCD